jgi:creatinine amidohydrolase
VKKVVLFEMCRADLENRSFDVAVVPIGATEVHAWHLPFGNDALHAAEIARRAAGRAAEKGAEILVLPTIPFGCSPDVMPYRYTLSVRPTTLFPLFEDIVASMAAHGIRKIVFLSGHGGNNGAIEAFRREFHGRYGAFLAQIEWWTTVADVVAKVRETNELDHADEIETSESLELCPELVRMDVAEPTSANPNPLKTFARHGGRFLRPWNLYTKNGGVGDPTRATREKGAAIVAAAVERIADMLVELARAKPGELCAEPSANA